MELNLLKAPYPVYNGWGIFFGMTTGWRNAVHIGAGWSSPVARQAHNLKVAGSNPAPATNLYYFISYIFNR